METVEICNRNNPKKVFEHDEIHYFYWPVELGVGYIKIKKYKIPLMPIKFFDYEPIKLNNVDGKKTITTRFHYKIFAYFNNLVLSKDKPIVDFSFGSHSPIAYIDLKNSRITTSTPYGRVDSREIDAFIVYCALYKKILDGAIKSENCELKSYQIETKVVGDEYLFEPKKMNALIALGTYPTPEELKKVGFEINV